MVLCARGSKHAANDPGHESMGHPPADDIKKGTGGVEPKLVPVRPLTGNSGGNSQEINLPPGQRLQTFGSGSVVFVNGGFQFLLEGGEQEP
jgi:hypothetical protein